MNFENGLSSIQQFEIRKMDDTELNNAIYDYVSLLGFETPENDATQKSVNPMAVGEAERHENRAAAFPSLSLTNEGEHLQELAVPHRQVEGLRGNIEIPDSIQSKPLDAVPVGRVAVQPHRKHRDKITDPRCHRNGHRCGERRAELHHQLLPSGGR